MNNTRIDYLVGAIDRLDKRMQHIETMIGALLAAQDDKGRKGKRAIAPVTSNPFDESMTEKQACAFLGISRWTLRRHLAPHHHIGRRPYWLRSEISAYRDANRDPLIP